MYKTVSDIGEFGLIDRIQKILPRSTDENVLVGIGDDTAVIRLDDHRCLLITCDIQVEDQHFRLKNITPYQLGRRAMAVNLSDIAAMGGSPTYALVSLGIPKSFSLTRFDELFSGMRDQLAEFSAFIIGGNLSNTADKLIIDITLMGEVALTQFLTRSGAHIGDRIFVTGILGLSAAGFHVLGKYGAKIPDEYASFVNAHLQPVPRVQFGQRIAASGIATSMLDISDGIAGDLHHICSMSHVGAEIHQALLPLPADIGAIESIASRSYLDLALHGGEDYELLFTVNPNVPLSEIQSIAEAAGVPVTEIGKIVAAEAGYHLIDDRGNQIPILPKGWDHFSISKKTNQRRDTEAAEKSRMK